MDPSKYLQHLNNSMTCLATVSFILTTELNIGLRAVRCNTEFGALPYYSVLSCSWEEYVAQWLRSWLASLKSGG